MNLYYLFYILFNIKSEEDQALKSELELLVTRLSVFYFYFIKHLNSFMSGIR